MKNNSDTGENMERFTDEFIVRRAVESDIDGIMDVARSVGNEDKVSAAGFLMDNYVKEYDYFRDKFLKLIGMLDYFYVLENSGILGFLIAYSKNQWLSYNPDWIESTGWHPEFDKKCLNRFAVVDKTAVLSGLTGKGLGSRMYRVLTADLQNAGIHDIFAETIISPEPNFASLNFRKKQNYNLAGVRYEYYKGTVYTDLVYHKAV